MSDRIVSHLLSVVLVFSLALADDGGVSGTPPARPVAPPPAAQDEDSVEADAGPRRDVTQSDLDVLLGEWIATPSLPQLGLYEVTSTWERVLDGAFLEATRVTTQGEHVSEERIMLGAPRGAPGLEYWLFDSAHSSGRLAEDREVALRTEGRLRVRPGAVWSVVFEGVVNGRPPDSPWRLTLSVYGHDRYDLLIERKPGNAWLPITRQEFMRVAEADGTTVAERDADR